MSSWSDRINEIINRLEAAAIGEAEADAARQARPMPVALPQAPAPKTRQQPVKPAVQKTVSPARPAASLPRIQASEMMQGVIFAEILGPPVARRRGRGRHGF